METEFDRPQRRGRGQARLLLLLAGLVIALLVLPGSAAGAPAAESPAAALSAAQGAEPAAAQASRRTLRRCPPRRVVAVAGVVRGLSIHCRIGNRATARRVNRAPVQIMRRPAAGRIVGVNRSRNLVRYQATQGFSGGDQFVVVRRSRGVRWRLVVRVRVTAPPVAAATSCTGQAARTNYQTPVRVAVTCSGTDITRPAIVSGPSHGTLHGIGHADSGAGRTLTAVYTPGDRFVGADEVRVEAHGAGGRSEAVLRIETLPWRMRAFGDSATAGFGFFADGSEMSIVQLLDCAPPTPVNDRCSSNSDSGAEYTGPVSWSPDFGLANDVSWAAQFANGWQGGGKISAPLMFQNRAVTGSVPADWLPGGALNDQLNAIVAENPDLIAFTLGVNPLLAEILEEGDEHACIAAAETIPALNHCIEPLIDAVQLPQRLQALYTTLLAAPDAEVVTFQYHLSYPQLAAIGGLPPWKVEGLVDLLNAEIAAAVAATRSALPSEGGRLTLIEAQVDPADEDPLKVPRFNLGVPPDANQTWTAAYECGGGGFTVDGPSHQAQPVQEMLPSLFSDQFCAGDPWMIAGDTGIHPNRAGYAQYAQALTRVAEARGLVPALP